MENTINNDNIFSWKEMKKTYHKSWYEFIDDNGESFYIFTKFKEQQGWKKWIEIEFYNFEKIKIESRPILRISTSFEGFNNMTRECERLCMLEKERSLIN